jgi:hypothetical protein
MDLYRGTFSGKQPDGIFTHLGTLLTACQRIETLFCNKSLRLFNGEKFQIYTNEGRPVKLSTPDAVYEEFLSFIERARIQLYRPSFGKGLRLRDCWEDDPIGSGALSIIDDETALPPKQLKELEVLFYPFSRDVLSMDVIDTYMSDEAVKSLERSGRSNPLFSQELEKRKNRTLLRGEDWQRVKKYEIVWVHYTLKLRAWALQNGYDFFEYKNENEDEGKLSYITLKANSVGKPFSNLGFDIEKLRETIAPLFTRVSIDRWHENKLAKSQSGNFNEIKDSFWCGFDPTQFIMPK